MSTPANSPDQTRVRQFVLDHRDAGWDKAWEAQVTPWDIGKPQPALQEFLESNALDLPRSGRALVPGCGRAYDAIAIARVLGLDVLAVDIARTAIASARAAIESADPPTYSKVTARDADFFTLDPHKDGLFELIYDYTFFVAIHPSRRDEWGRQMSTLIKPGGYLITIVYPMDPEQDGPPYFVIPEHYHEPLGNGWRKVYDDVPKDIVESPNLKGRERLIVWKKL